MKLNILFLCTGNSCRSQMAEGWGKYLKGNQYNFYSAGTTTHGLNPYAIKVMMEEGIDLSQHRSKNVKELLNQKMDYVFTVCSDAQVNCPFFPSGKIIHVGFDDPPKLTKNFSGEEEKLKVYRRVRDEIKEFVMNLEKYMENNQ